MGNDMDQERDKFLTEQMDECWHEPGETRLVSGNKISKKCRCGINSSWEFFGGHGRPNPTFKYLNNNFSTWQGFGKLWEWAQKQEWWDKFKGYCNGFSKHRGLNNGWEIPHGWKDSYINPDRFADAVAEFLKERE